MQLTLGAPPLAVSCARSACALPMHILLLSSKCIFSAPLKPGGGLGVALRRLPIRVVVVGK